MRYLGGRADASPPPTGIRCGTKTLGIRRVKRYVQPAKHTSKIVGNISFLLKVFLKRYFRTAKHTLKISGNILFPLKVFLQHYLAVFFLLVL